MLFCLKEVNNFIEFILAHVIAAKRDVTNSHPAMNADITDTSTCFSIQALKSSFVL